MDLILRVRLRPQILNKNKVILCLSCSAVVANRQANPKHKSFRASWEYSSACEGSSSRSSPFFYLPSTASRHPLGLPMICNFVKFNSKSVMSSVLSPLPICLHRLWSLNAFLGPVFCLARSSLQIQSATTPLKSFWFLLKYS